MRPLPTGKVMPYTRHPKREQLAHIFPWRALYDSNGISAHAQD